MARFWIVGSSDALKGRNQLRDPFEGKILSLHGHNQRLSGREDIEGEQIERGRAIEEDQIVAALDRFKALAQAKCTVFGAGKLDICASQVLRAGQQPKAVDFSGQNHLFRAAVADQNVIDRMAIVVALETEAGGGIGLRIAVDEQDLEPLERQAGGKIDGSGGFAHSALLIYDPDDLSHGIPE